jgi:hypothetical protein
MRTALGLICFLGAFVLLIVEIVAVGDPGTLPASDQSAPWYAHIIWFAMIGALGWMAMRLLRDGIGRLIRGRGFTPADR